METLELFEETELTGLTSLPGGFPVKIFPSQAKARASKGNAPAYGQKCFESFSNADPVFASLKTFLRSAIEAQTGYSATWKEQATQQGRSWSVLTTSARPTDASESGLWPAATCNLASGGGNFHSPQVQAGRHGLNLQGALENWPTPKAEEASHSGRQTNSGCQEHLTVSANLWPTPTITGNYNRQGASATSGDGIETASRAFLPPETTSEVGLLLQVWTPPSCPALSVKFVEWLQGYPEGWTELPEASETTD